ncbi:ABC transporter ATP-binding protein [Microcystis elabens FACHB-917]|nr:ABC transporter ATP-binding protein [Microcystis elabens FACHB-917]
MRDWDLIAHAIAKPSVTPATAAATPSATAAGTVSHAGEAGHGAHVRIEDLWYRYPGRDVSAWTLQGIDLALVAGELVGLLGPSGCGKTTLLRLIAGFERPGRGSIRIGGQQVAAPDRLLPPERRGVGMVFQDDALFPHLDAWRNACFGLRRGQDTARVAWLLDLLGLAGLERRYPHELSGGQRQRLAMARALAPSPSVVLLDEPFSNLDVEVRLRLRSELPAVLARCGASGLMVTHDPEEALAICDRVGVLRDGVLHQCAPPRELVDRPATAFVGQFVLQANLLPARWRGWRLQTALGELEPLADGDQGRGGSEAVEVMVRPQALEFLPREEGSAWITGREFLGREWLYQVQLGDQRLRWRAPLDADHPHGRRGRLCFRAGETALLFPGGRPLLTLPAGRTPGPPLTSS